MTQMTVNGQPMAFSLDPATPLLEALREAANLTGTKRGCDDGGCHACTVLVDGVAVRACALSIARAEGAVVTTIEGLPPSHPLFAAWRAEQPSMCGFCDPGFLVALAGLLQVNTAPSEEELAMLPNRCACGAGPRILRAARAAAAALRAAATPDEARPTSAFSLGSRVSADTEMESNRND
ncbi:(2Fe-2S)-binding protein [Sphingomicrobium astaxanthinifaciens]|uniref:(2Fe-2S)-binding protein n=1 Tax=Sphingomicrobium astaxanthinifaciens TaxID=1227949 RepID=UPI001FCC71A6|nr:2Fe-2S iron-sulfur cluster-binding protein [Sphingomicrobium astaxanthinifaciens]MCJ7420926.1 2Fe-2S iron-sulfur cluster-binding protein [Sphingomicrobium astaxanthinifaciens]